MATYLTKFNGEIGLADGVNPVMSSKIEDIIKTTFVDVMSYVPNDKMLYVAGEFDDREELIEKFIVKILPIVDNTQVFTITAKGETLTDRYDLVIKVGKLYVQEYELHKTVLRIY